MSRAFHRISSNSRLLVALISLQALCLVSGLWLKIQLQSSVSSAMLQFEQRNGKSSGTGLGSEKQLEVQLVVHAVAFVWIMGLQSVTAWYLLERHWKSHSRRADKEQEDALLAAKELMRTRDAIIFGLAKLAESRDPETGQHLERISLYSMKLASALRRHPKFRDQISPNFVKTIGISSVLHDIGKVGVEDSVLLKPGKLSEDERFKIQVHANLGGDCIQEIERRLGDSDFLRMAKDIAYYHHERWDGTGYPFLKAGEAIPLAARIVSIADVYDALSVVRVYKPAYPHERCVEEITKGSGTQFDPELVQVFLSISDQFAEISERFSDQKMRSGKISKAQEHLLASIFESGHVAQKEIEETADSTWRNRSAHIMN